MAAGQDPGPRKSDDSTQRVLDVGMDSPTSVSPVLRIISREWGQQLQAPLDANLFNSCINSLTRLGLVGGGCGQIEISLVATQRYIKTATGHPGIAEKWLKSRSAAPRVHCSWRGCQYRTRNQIPSPKLSPFLAGPNTVLHHQWTVLVGFPKESARRASGAAVKTM